MSLHVAEVHCNPLAEFVECEENPGVLLSGGIHRLDLFHHTLTIGQDKYDYVFQCALADAMDYIAVGE